MSKKSLETQKIKTILPVKEIKEECLSEYYKASIKKGQAELLKEDITPPVQKKVPNELEELTDKRNITKDKISGIEEAINLYKQHEYGNVKELKSEEMDKLVKKISSF